MTSPRKPTWVYFMRPVGFEGPVKIGFSSLPEERLLTYAVISPLPLEIAARIPGGQSLEMRFHQRFAALHSHHEWFRASPELTRVIAEVAADAFDIDTLPPAKRLDNVVRWTTEVRLGASLSHRLSWMKRRGAGVPREVWDALIRWQYAERRGGVRDPRDLAFVQAFVGRQPQPEGVAAA